MALQDRTASRVKRILVCDDERNVVRLVRTCLEPRGHTVVSCYHGPDALELIKQEKFDLLILDVMMPVMDGLEVLKEIRMNPDFSDLQVIMLTAKSSDADVFTAYKYGVDLYLTKPFDTSDLVLMAERL